MDLTRQQLAEFLPDPRTIKQFEKLIGLVSGLESDTLQFLSLLAGGADSKANEALAQLTRIADSLEILATKPATRNDTFLTGDYIDFPLDGPHVSKERRLQWNEDDGTLDVGLFGDSVLQVGQETMFYAKNTSGATISNGTPVMFTGTVGSSGKLTFGLAVADGSVSADYMMGVATQNIANNAFGYVTSFGLVRGFNTTGAPYGEVWADGDLLYFGAVTAGTWTKTQPTAPKINSPVAVVVNAGSGGSGSIMVHMKICESISRLKDCYVSGPSDGEVLTYVSANQRWENAAKGSATGTFVAGAKTITVTNGYVESIV